MSNDLSELYQDVIIDHSRHPQNFRRLADATRTVEGMNPLCGDQITLYVKLLDDRIDDIAFEGVGCAISVASASLMTTALKGKRSEDALALFGFVHVMLTESQGRAPRGGARQARRALGSLGVPHAGEVRDARLARATQCARRKNRDGLE